MPQGQSSVIKWGILQFCHNEVLSVGLKEQLTQNLNFTHFLIQHRVNGNLVYTIDLTKQLNDDIGLYSVAASVQCIKAVSLNHATSSLVTSSHRGIFSAGCWWERFYSTLPVRSCDLWSGYWPCTVLSPQPELDSTNIWFWSFLKNLTWPLGILLCRLRNRTTESERVIKPLYIRYLLPTILYFTVRWVVVGLSFKSLVFQLPEGKCLCLHLLKIKIQN